MLPPWSSSSCHEFIQRRSRSSDLASQAPEGCDQRVPAFEYDRTGRRRLIDLQGDLAVIRLRVGPLVTLDTDQVRRVLQTHTGLVEDSLEYRRPRSTAYIGFLILVRGDVMPAAILILFVAGWN